MNNLFKEENKEFWQYHCKHPEIWEQFKKITFQTIEKGFDNYGSKGIFELIRWHTKQDIKSDGFKVNNIYTPHYARYFELVYPKHKGFFRKRTSKANILK